MLTFTSDCKKLLVANEGRPGKDINNVFTDPVGSITIIERDRHGGPPSERTVSFTGQDQRYKYIETYYGGLFSRVVHFDLLKYFAGLTVCIGIFS